MKVVLYFSNDGCPVILYTRRELTTWYTMQELPLHQITGIVDTHKKLHLFEQRVVNMSAIIVLLNTRKL